jgi:TRAP-type C4-dicarboxylate transport system permease small subunit
MKLSTKRLHSWSRRLVALENALLSLLLSSMILLAAFQILLRNGFSSGISWADPALRLSVLWVAMLGAMAASRAGRHIRIDVLSYYLTDRAKSISRFITNSFSALICALLAWHAGRLVFYEWADGTTLFSGFPTWLGAIILPIGFGIMSSRFLLTALLQRQPEGDT